MATYDNRYATTLNITPANPNLRGMSDNFSNDGQTNLGGYGLGNIYELDYDRNKIEQIFNQGTDAQYALMQKEAQVAENNYANQQFQNQFNTMEALRAQRNEQIASGMARGLSAASDQATALGIQQEAMNGALELAQNRQMQADQIAAEYAQNVVKALQEANSVKTAMAQVAANLYEADMLGYTGELSAAAQMDANASDRYGYDLGLEGTKYNADKGLEGTKYAADKQLAGTLDYNNKYYGASIYGADRSLEGTKYNADRNYAAAVQSANIQAAATRAAAEMQAAASRISAGSGNNTEDTIDLIDQAVETVKQRGYKNNRDLINQVQNFVVTKDDHYRNRDQTQLRNDIKDYLYYNSLLQYPNANDKRIKPNSNVLAIKRAEINNNLLSR